MCRTEIILKEWDGQENPYGNPENRQESEIWELMLAHFQQYPSHQYLKHMHEYQFTPEVPERIEGSGIGRSRVGHYKEVVMVYWQAANDPKLSHAAQER